MPVDRTSATLLTHDNRPVLRFERRLGHPPEKVWTAITDPAEMAHWFPAAVEAELAVGAKMRFTFERADVDAPDGEIVELDRPRVFAFRWGDDLLRWELIPEEGGCRLRFTQAFGEQGMWGGRIATARHAAGWELCLDALAARLDGRSWTPPEHAWFERYEGYMEAFGLADGEALDSPDGYLIRFERDLVQPVATVWDAITGQDGTPRAPTAADGRVTGWARPPRDLLDRGIDTEADTEADTDPGGAVGGAVTAGRVSGSGAPRVLEYAWRHRGAPAGRVRWELTSQPFGARLLLTQTVPAALADLRPAVLAGWQVHLDRLIASLHGVTRPWPSERAEALRAMYADRLDRTTGAPTAAADGGGE